MNDFFSFRSMITPVLLQALWVVEACICVAVGLWLLISQQRIEGLLLAFAGPIVARISAECAIVFFRLLTVMEENQRLLAQSNHNAAMTHHAVETFREDVTALAEISRNTEMFRKDSLSASKSGERTNTYRPIDLDDDDVSGGNDDES